MSPDLAARHLLLALLLPFALALSGCAEPAKNPEPVAAVCDIQLSETKGVIHRNFSAPITVVGNWVKRPVFCVVGTLPPGVKLVGAFDTGVVDGRPHSFSYTGLLEGTPRQSGIFSIRVRVRDRDRGTAADPTPYTPRGGGLPEWYVETFTLRIYDRLDEAR